MFIMISILEISIFHGINKTFQFKSLNSCIVFYYKNFVTLMSNFKLHVKNIFVTVFKTLFIVKLLSAEKYDSSAV